MISLRITFQANTLPIVPYILLDMVNRIGTVYPCGLNKGFGLRFCVGSWVWDDTPEESQRAYRPKCCEYNNADEDNSLNILSGKNYQASAPKFRQIIILFILFSRTNSGLCLYNLLVWSSFYLLHNSCWITFPTQSCLVLNSFFASFLHLFIMGLLSLL